MTAGAFEAGPLAAVEDDLRWVTAGIEAISIVILLIGAARFVLRFLRAELLMAGEARRHGADRARLELGRYILAGLELLIVADVVHTAFSYSLEGAAYLGVLVAVRSAISFFLTREIEGLEARERREGSA